MHSAHTPFPSEASPAADSPELYHVVMGDVGRDAATILGLWAEGLGHNGVPQGKFDWYYRRNPTAAPKILLLSHKGTPGHIGVAALGEREIYANGAPVRCGEMIDFVVLPAHRTLYPAMRIMRGMYLVGLDSYPFMYGLPNPKSLAVVRRVGYKRFGEMRRYARVLRSAPYLKKRLPTPLAWMANIVGPLADTARRLGSLLSRGPDAFRATWVDMPDARFDGLWARVLKSPVIIGQRNAAFLQWRFAECPLHRYRFFALESGDAKDILAYAVCEREGAALHVQDFLIDLAKPDLMRALWSRLAAEAYRMGCDSIATEFFGREEIHQALIRAGLSPRSSRAICSMCASDHAHMEDTGQWYMTSADEDG
jgi:hypothetical protein